MVEQRELLERYLVRFGADERAGHVVDVINNHHQLALTVPDEAGVGDVRARAGGRAHAGDPRAGRSLERADPLWEDQPLYFETVT